MARPESSAHPTRTREEADISAKFEGMLISLSILYQPFHHYFFTGSAMERVEETPIPGPSTLLTGPTRYEVDGPSLNEISTEKSKGMLTSLSVLYQPFHH